MKVKKSTTTFFQPFSLQIEIETQEELDAFREMAYYNASIPELLEKKNHQVIISEFLGIVQETLIE
jgi:hypothetical protein